jgi:hypothetical protein
LLQLLLQLPKAFQKILLKDVSPQASNTPKDMIHLWVKEFQALKLKKESNMAVILSLLI